MQTNDGCQLPCWWGITPGQSTLIDIRSKLIPLSGISLDGHLNPSRAGDFSIRYPVDNMKMDLYIGYFPILGQRTIEMIYIWTQVLREIGEGSREYAYDAVFYNEILNAYTLSGILSEFGPPSSVLVRAENFGSSPAPIQMAITLLYPEQGVFVRYKMPSERKGDIFSGCPSKAFIGLWLIPPNIGDNYQDILSSQDSWEGNLYGITPLEEATQMTIDEFYQTFKEPTDTCVQTPVDIWPNP